MLLKRFYDEKLAQASYLLGCQATGEALVVDPHRDVDRFVEAAEREGLSITHIAETHIHADFVSGARELAARTGGRLYLSDEGGADWRYAFAEEADAVLLRDGSSFEVGNVRIDVLHTPGHTPEHLCFVVTDTAAGEEPMGVFTGDFIFVGDVGRPDLLERAARHEGTMEAGARTLHRSLQSFVERLPDYVQLWPGHGAGSACGKSLGAVPQSTLGYEKLVNWALAPQSEDEFVRGVLSGQPEPPMYFAEMKRINREGPPVLGGFRRPQRLPESRLEALLEEGAVVVDTRAETDYAAGHVPGTLTIPATGSFTTWAGSVLPYGRDIFLIVGSTAGEPVDQIVRDLAMIGLDRVGGWFGPEVVQAWEDAGHRLDGVEQVSPDRVAERMENGEVEVLDVRNPPEWEAGHLPGSLNLPLGRLVENLDRIPRDRPLVVHCETGARSAVAIGLLRASGFNEVRHLRGDFSGWKDDGRPVEKSDAEVEV